MPDTPAPPKKAGKLPVWAYVVAAGIGVLLVWFLFRSKPSTQSADDGRMSLDEAAAGAGQPSRNFTGYDTGVDYDAEPGGSNGSTGAVSGRIFSCRNNNRECPPLMHCDNATGRCKPHLGEEPGKLHDCYIGESVGDCRRRQGL